VVWTSFWVVWKPSCNHFGPVFKWSINHSQASQSSPVQSISKKGKKNRTGLDFKTLCETPQDCSAPPNTEPSGRPENNGNHPPPPQPPQFLHAIHYIHCRLKRRSNSRLPLMQQPHHDLHRQLKYKWQSRSSGILIHQLQSHCNPTLPPG